MPNYTRTSSDVVANQAATATQYNNLRTDLKDFLDTIFTNPSAGEWNLNSLLPKGAINIWSTASAPDGWLLCDGSSLLRASYAALFAVIGTTYGSVDGTHFNLPNLKGRVVVGLNASETEFDGLGELGGEKTHQLTEAELAAHTHSNNQHNHGGATGGTQLNPSQTGQTSGGSARRIDTQNLTGTIADTSHQHSITAESITINNAGSNTAHNNLQPYMALNYIIKF
jgi:microcystin-dependent protein